MRPALRSRESLALVNSVAYTLQLCIGESMLLPHYQGTYCTWPNAISTLNRIWSGALFKTLSFRKILLPTTLTAMNVEIPKYQVSIYLFTLGKILLTF